MGPALPTLLLQAALVAAQSWAVVGAGPAEATALRQPQWLAVLAARTTATLPAVEVRRVLTALPRQLVATARLAEESEVVLAAEAEAQRSPRQRTGQLVETAVSRAAAEAAAELE